MSKSIKTAELFDCQVPYLSDFFNSFEYPWQMLPEIKELCVYLLSNSDKKFKRIAPDIIIGENVTIDETVKISGPAIIGDGTQIRHGAYLRGNVITGKNCVIGNSTEIKNSLLLDKVQAPHYNYIGDSILGTRVHLGAGVICSNFKGDGTNIKVQFENTIETGLRKMGAILGDRADIGCNCVLNPGTIIGKGSRVYPLNCLRGVYEAGILIKSNDSITKLK